MNTLRRIVRVALGFYSPSWAFAKAAQIGQCDGFHDALGTECHCPPLSWLDRRELRNAGFLRAAASHLAQHPKAPVRP